jgi:hypothetical protein
VLDPDPDLFVRGTDPELNTDPRAKMSRILNTDYWHDVTASIQVLCLG